MSVSQYLLVKRSLTSLAAIRHYSPTGALWLGTYVAAATLVFGAVALWLNANQQHLYQLVLDYLFPPSWHGWVPRLVDFFFASQTKMVVAGLILNTALVLAAIVLFPLKEHCSAYLERGLSRTRPPRDLPLTTQALEELKLLVFYATLQGIILAIGYYPFIWCKWLSTALSMLTLWFCFCLDFIAPTLQRHRLDYFSMVTTLLRRWPAALLFGALLTAPLVAIAHSMMVLSEWTLLEITSLLFLLNVAAMTLAIPAGTRLALHLLPQSKLMHRAPRRYRHGSYATVLFLFCVGAAFHSTVAISLHHKSQVLKCDYQIDWGSLNTNLDSLSHWLRGEETAQVQFDMEIANPTPFDVRLERSKLRVYQYEKEVGSAQLNALNVPSQSQVTQHIALAVAVNLGNLANWGHMREGWQILIEFELLPGIPFLLRVL